MTQFDFDVIIIGSGFGGSVMTCRLAEKGYRTCLLERGKEYGMGDFPRRASEFRESVWDPKDRKYGLWEILAHPNSDVFTLTGSGLGGGSLIYANVSIPMDPEYFKDWPGSIDYKMLQPYYEKVSQTMEVAPYPFEDPYYADTPKTVAIQNAIAKLPVEKDGLSPPKGLFPNLAIWFKGNYPGQQMTNMHGATVSKCTKCGECTIGCNIHAKNTLNLNYIARARNQSLLGKNGKAAVIKTQSQVVDIKPLESSGYVVEYQCIEDETTIKVESLTAKKVIVACGAVNTPALLLNLKKSGSLPNISDQLGKHWCGNGDLEATIIDSSKKLDPSIGPAITYAIQYKYSPYPDGFPHGIYIEEGGVPPAIAWYIIGKMPSAFSIVKIFKLIWKFLRRAFKRKPEINIGDDLVDLIDNDKFLRHSMMLLAMGRDRSDGTVKIDSDGTPIINWQIKNSKLHLQRQKSAMQELSKALNGKLLLNPLTYIDKLVVVHSLGGCIMADDQEHGVVDTNGEVFSYPGLHVIDGSIIPTSIGPNPSLTIAALAEMIAEKFEIDK